MHIRTPRECLDGEVRIEWKSDGFDPSGQGENRARAVNEVIKSSTQTPTPHSPIVLPLPFYSHVQRL